MAKYDWLLAYQGAKAGAFGEGSQDVIDRIKKAAGSDFDDAMAKGIVNDKGFSEQEVTNETGTGKTTKYDSNGVDWSKAPALPKNAQGTYLFNIGGRAGTEDMHDTVGKTYDENYGWMGIGLSQSKKDFADIYLPMIATMFAGGPIAGAIAGAAGFAAGGIGSYLTNLGVNTALGSVVSGKAPDLKSLGISALGAGLTQGIGNLVGPIANPLAKAALNTGIKSGVGAAFGKKQDPYAILASILGSSVKGK